MKALTVYSIHLEDGKFITEYVSANPPPKVGETISLLEKGVYEVLEVSYKPIRGHEIVVLKVKPVKQ